jgi:hypothetical protein
MNNSAHKHDPTQHIDCTTDQYYPLRILRAYRDNCDARAKVLEDAIAILEREMV